MLKEKTAETVPNKDDVNLQKPLQSRELAQLKTIEPLYVETLVARNRMLYCIGLWADREKAAQKGHYENDISFGGCRDVGGDIVGQRPSGRGGGGAARNFGGRSSAGTGSGDWRRHSVWRAVFTVLWGIWL
jgi:hypothetical protein